VKKIRIRPDISGTVAVWELEKKLWNRWYHLYKHEDINIVKKMKDHLLQLPLTYTMKNNVPEKPLRTTPSTWTPRPRLKRLRIKRQDLPESLRD
jgi:hypothetical protein